MKIIIERFSPNHVFGKINFLDHPHLDRLKIVCAIRMNAQKGQIQEKDISRCDRDMTARK